MNVKIIYYCYIIYLIFHFVLLSCDILTRYQISQTLKNILTVYKKQDKKSSNEELVNFSSTVTLISKTLTRMGNAYDYCIGSQNYRVAIHVISKGQTTLSEAGCTSFPWLTGLLFWFTVGCCFHCRRASFYACRLDKHLYVIGGRNETGYLSSVECYNLETNEWRYVSSLPQPLAAHAGAVHNGKIYISGKSFLHFLLQSSIPRHFLDLYVYV